MTQERSTAERLAPQEDADMAMQELIKEGLSLVNNDPQHDLRLGFRCRLRSSLDEASEGAARRAGHIRRVRLAMLGVEKVLPLWELLLPEDLAPHQALALVAKVADGGVSIAAAKNNIDAMWTHCDDLLAKHQRQEEQSVILVGYAAIQAVRVALLDFDFGCENANSMSMDFENDAYEHDSSFFAAAAYSRGAVWEEESDSNRRLEFWTWWLTVAVGAALRAA